MRGEVGGEEWVGSSPFILHCWIVRFLSCGGGMVTWERVSLFFLYILD